MLNLVTGLPGAAKTLYVLSKMLPQYRGRKIFVYGIPAIDHDFFATSPLDDPEKWYECPEASVIVMDEAQKVFPTRSTGSAVPRKCSEFETHRHKGFDVVLITQDAGLLDVHVRKLAGKHVHVHRLFGSQTSNIYEYGEWTKDPSGKVSRAHALSTATFKFPKEIFDRYKSADAHTVKRKLPKKLLVAPLALLALIACVYWAYVSITKLKITGEEIDQALYGHTGSAAATSPASASDPVGRARAFLPAVEGLPWTAPAYAGVMQVRTFPKPQCIMFETASGSNVFRCQCYTQQSTKMQGVPVEVCKDIALNGWFDYTQADARDGSRGKRETARADGAGQSEQ